MECSETQSSWGEDAEVLGEEEGREVEGREGAVLRSEALNMDPTEIIKAAPEIAKGVSEVAAALSLTPITKAFFVPEWNAEQSSPAPLFLSSSCSGVAGQSNFVAPRH
jgi:hypothetical protein